MEPIAKAQSSATLSTVVVRACTVCGGKREQGSPCVTCGNKKEPVIHDLGVQAASFSNPAKQLWWDTIGKHLAARRVSEANKYVEG